MKVIVFDLLPYKENLDHLKEGLELPWPLEKRYFNPRIAAQTYEEHLEALRKSVVAADRWAGALSATIKIK